MRRIGLFRTGATGRLRVLLLALVALGSCAIGIITYSTSLLGSLEGSTINGRFSVRGTQHPPKNIVLVAIDTKSLQDLNNFPYPRTFYARVLDNLAAQHPAAVAFDLELADKGTIGVPGFDRGELETTCQQQGITAPCEDLALLNAMDSHHGLTVFATTAPSANGNGQMRFLGYKTGTDLLHALHSRPGAALFPNNQPGGVYRQMIYSVQNIQTLPVATVAVATHKPVPRFTGNQWIDFPGAAHTIPYVSFSSVYDPKRFGALPPNYFRGKIVVVGATDLSLQDFHATSTDGQMPGPEIQADAIATILRNFPLKSVPGWVNIVLIILMAFAVPLASLRLGPVPSLAISVGLAALFVVGTQLAFNAGHVNAFVYPMGTLILSAAGALSVQLVTEAFERIRTRDLFARFVPENVVDEVLANADGLRLGGVQREGTVMFTDLRGFTSFAETLTPPQVIDVLNHYLSEMSDAILNHGGTLVAYMGDGIFAVFGAPLQMEDHADRALATAQEMLSVRLPRFNEWIRSEGLGDGFRMGIGLNSGHVMSGHVGSERRVEYAAVGDTTNTASRIEALTKGTPHQLLMSGSTKDALTSAAEDLVHVGETDIRGRVGKLELWTVGEEAQASPAKEPEVLQASGPTV
jgi:adenylate cyclase